MAEIKRVTIPSMRAAGPPTHVLRECKQIQSLWETVWRLQKVKYVLTVRFSHFTSTCLYKINESICPHKDLEECLWQLYL